MRMVTLRPATIRLFCMVAKKSRDTIDNAMSARPVTGLKRPAEQPGSGGHEPATTPHNTCQRQPPRGARRHLLDSKQKHNVIVPKVLRHVLPEHRGRQRVGQFLRRICQSRKRRRMAVNEADVVSTTKSKRPEARRACNMSTKHLAVCDAKSIAIPWRPPHCDDDDHVSAKKNTRDQTTE